MFGSSQQGDTQVQDQWGDDIDNAIMAEQEEEEDEDEEEEENMTGILSPESSSNIKKVPPTQKISKIKQKVTPEEKQENLNHLPFDLNSGDDDIIILNQSKKRRLEEDDDEEEYYSKLCKNI